MSELPAATTKQRHLPGPAALAVSDVDRRPELYGWP
jgi:hypothetical protein